MKPEQLQDAMNGLDEEILKETEAIRQNPKGHKVIPFRRYASVAGLGLVLGVSLLAGSVLDRSQKETSGGISENSTESAYEEGIAESKKEENAAASANEESLFSDVVSESEDSANKQEGAETESMSGAERSYFTDYNTDVFRGTVLKTKLVHLNEDEESLTRIVATIQLSKVYRGALTPGDTITLIVGKQAEVSTELTDSVTGHYIEPGMHGIFMAVPSTETQIDADYELPDNLHFAFLETSQGLIFERDAYTEISDAETLNDIETYIETKLKSIP